MHDCASPMGTHYSLPIVGKKRAQERALRMST